MKRLSAIIIALLVLLTAAVPAVCAGTTERSRVTDKADLLTAQEEASLEDTLREYSTNRDADIVVLTEPSLVDEGFSFNGTVADYADRYYETGGFDRDGVVIFITLDDGQGGRELYISQSGKCMSSFSDDERDDVLQSAAPELRAGNYYEALMSIAKGINDSMEPESKWYMLPLAIAIGIAIALLIMLSIRGKLKSVRMQRSASTYVRPGSMNVAVARDTFLYSTVAVTPRQTSSSSSSHTSSGGGVHSGGGIKF